jgi:hypothetical protein
MICLNDIWHFYRKKEQAETERQRDKDSERQIDRETERQRGRE